MSVVPPANARELARWFAEAVHAEVAELEKKGGEQRYELLSGQRVTPDASPYAIYRFTLADAALVPEDSSGAVEVDGRLLKAKINAQETNRIDVEIEGDKPMNAFIPRAILHIDDLSLMRELADELDTTAAPRGQALHFYTSLLRPSSYV